jgi:hypothetical protein
MENREELEGAFYDRALASLAIQGFRGISKGPHKRPDDVFSVVFSVVF